jgi:Domain of unknown function (DU1801)
MQSSATTVASYLAELPPDRKAALQAILKVIRKNIDPAFKEGMQYGMIGWHVPRKLYPAGYHCDPKQPLPFAGLASQKNYMSLYMGCLYTDGSELARFQKNWRATGKKLDMGKCCIRFKKLDDLPLEVIGEAFARIKVQRFIADYELSKPRKAAKKK